MANKTQVNYRSLSSLAKRIRRDLNGVMARKKSRTRKGTSFVKGVDYVLIFAHNGVGKTRLSRKFKDIAKSNNKLDTLYFNAFTEDLFTWDNDLPEDIERKLEYKSESNFFQGLDGMQIEQNIREYLNLFADFDFYIDYEEAEIRFSREVIVNGNNQNIDYIKISRGEENIFIWCFFLAIARLATDSEKGMPYDWVKYIYIDDPVSSLDEHNTIAVASCLAELLLKAKGRIKAIISTHHSLFFNVMFNELSSHQDTTGKRVKVTKKAYILDCPCGGSTYKLCDTTETPFLHHVSALNELKQAIETGRLFYYHFNVLRSILEKTATFFGRKHMSTCFEGLPQKNLASSAESVG